MCQLQSRLLDSAVLLAAGRRRIRVVLGACSLDLIWRKMGELRRAFDGGRNKLKHGYILRNL